MVLETSAVIAMMQQEDGFETLFEKMAIAKCRCISAASYFESSMVLIGKRGDDAGRELDAFLAEAIVEMISVSGMQARIARDAFLRYGKGRGNPAQLNFGDCLSYALAKQKSEPLLFVGHDFSHTDILIA